VCARAAHCISSFDLQPFSVQFQNMSTMGKSEWMLFSEKCRKKWGVPKTLAMLAMLAMLLFAKAQQ
jgi:hypothetical protein